MNFNEIKSMFNLKSFKGKDSSISSSHIDQLKQFGFEKFGDFNDEDVFIVGYPKSGNTLLQHIIAHLVFGLNKDCSKALINSCVTEFYNNPWFFRLDKKHFFKSHELPKIEYKKVIYIVRDGRDAVRSFYYMQKNMGRKLSLEKLYMSGGNTFVGNWSDHVMRWIENPYQANMLIIKYEDLLVDKKREILRILDFLNLQRSEEAIKTTIEATSFENMKKMENSFSWQRSKSFKTWKQDANFVREGKAKGFEEDEEINNEWLKYFEKESQLALKQFNYI